MSRYALLDPDAKVDWTENWSDWLDAGVNIATATWSISPSGPTLSDQADTATASTIFITGGTRGVLYRLSCKIVTDAVTPQTDERSIALRCEHR